MKKLVSFILVLAMCVSMVACGGADSVNKQPAIDAHNKAGDAVNELVEIINQDPETYADYIDDIAVLVDTLNEVGEVLESSDDLDQEALNEWTEACKEVEQIAIDVKAELGY